MASRLRPAVPFGVTFAVAVLIGLAGGDEPFYWDSGGYWRLGETFTSGGGFALLDFDSPLRGYSLPLLLAVLREGADAVGMGYGPAVVLFNSLLVALIATVLAPRLAATIWPERPWGELQVALMAGAILLFWHGYVSYPLTDLPGLALAMLALIAVARAGSSARWALTAGLATALAVNMRPAYVLLVPVVIGLFAWDWYASRASTSKPGRRLAFLALIVLGALLVSLPQSLATHKHHGSANPLPGAAEDLSGRQLTFGMLMQRYDTYVGMDELGAGMQYIDPRGTALLEEEGGRIVSSGQYLRLVVEHPPTMGLIGLRHLVNGLDARYPTPYVEDVAPQRLLRIAGFAIVFAGLLRLVWPAARELLGRSRWLYLAALPLICATSVPAAVETRFLLPIYLACYLLVLAAPWPNPLADGLRSAATGRRVGLLAVGLVAFAILVGEITSGASENLEFR